MKKRAVEPAERSNAENVNNIKSVETGKFSTLYHCKKSITGKANNPHQVANMSKTALNCNVDC